MPDSRAQFQVFREAVVASFSFLRQRGFTPEVEKASQGSNAIEIGFSRTPLRIAVAFERGSAPWVYFQIGDQRFGLHLLVEDRDRNDPAVESVANHQLSEQVAALAQLTQRHADDFLAGDYSRMPRLKDLRARLTRERNQQMYGTATGESPRFRGKPALSELFADAGSSALRAARAYQAFWDYGYAQDEIAVFLEVTTADVEDLLRSWESADS